MQNLRFVCLAFLVFLAGCGRDGATLPSGTVAPDFTLKDLSGKEVTLSAHKGKDVVVLDFWATWCGPCVQALPIVAEVTAGYRDKGVVFYALNQRETPEEIQAFLREKKLSLSVLLDPGKVAEAYKVEGIPHLIVVGKDGTIAASHVGYEPEMGAWLKKTLDAALKQ